MPKIVVNKDVALQVWGALDDSECTEKLLAIAGSETTLRRLSRAKKGFEEGEWIGNIGLATGWSHQWVQKLKEYWDEYTRSRPLRYETIGGRDREFPSTTQQRKADGLVLSQLGFGNCLRKRLRLLPFFRSVDVGGWQPWDENGMWSGWKGKNETSWND